MNRLFTFGCSFTSYNWPTWADILGQEFNEFQNWARPGAGNYFIFNSVVECALQNNLTKDDTVVIMWSSTCREDRYLDKGWMLLGNIYNQHFYNKDYIENYVHNRGFLIRDLAFIYATKQLLDNIGVKHIFTSMLPINMLESENNVDTADVFDFYHNVMNYIRPSVYEKIFNFDWYSRPFVNMNPTEDSYYAIAGPDWPSYDFFLKRKFKKLTPDVHAEMDNIIKLSQIERYDFHPTPAEHLEYIESIMPEFCISNTTKKWVSELEQRVRLMTDLEDIWKPTYPTRL